MKKVFLLVAVLSCISCALQAHPQEVYARSYLATRPVHSHISTKEAIWHNIYPTKQGRMLASFQAVGLYQETREAKNIERYFLPGRSNTLLVAGDNALNKECRHVRAEWLGLPANFSGRMSINPEQRQAGLLLEFNQDFKKFLDGELFENWWITISAPFIWVENKLNLTQCDIINQGKAPNPRDIIAAFNQEAWKFGKIVEKRSETQLAEILIQLGSTYLDDGYNQLIYYSGITVPTSKKTNPVYLFDAVTGTNGHWGITAGLNIQFLLNKDTSRFAFCFFIDLDEKWLIFNKQCRTFDLKDKPWSRFMLYNTQTTCESRQNRYGHNLLIACDNRQFVPGVNLLTHRVVVRPWAHSDFSMGWRLKIGDNVEMELGYGLWGHDEERIKWSDPDAFPENYFGIAGSAGGKTASKSFICNQAEDDKLFNQITGESNDAFVAVKRCDIDLKSGATGSALNQKAHLAIGYYSRTQARILFLGAGYFTEFAKKNGSLKTWGVWGKFGASF